MSAISKIYSQYKIPPQLQVHQLRVASVAKIIINSFIEEFQNSKEVITACLLHDMGNIIKFDLTMFPEFLEPQGYNYWKKVQDEFIKKYGIDEHKATYDIAKELNANPEVLSIIGNLGFSKSIENSKHEDFGIKITAYSDNRVGPHGVLSLEERINEGKSRFKRRNNYNVLKNEEGKFNLLTDAAIKIEKQIFGKVNIRPQNINDESVNQIIEDLKNWEI